jgi:hypothetical protein
MELVDYIDIKLKIKDLLSLEKVDSRVCLPSDETQRTEFIGGLKTQENAFQVGFI